MKSETERVIRHARILAGQYKGKVGAGPDPARYTKAGVIALSPAAHRALHREARRHVQA